eukprot:COSAG01_NODE_1280_length_10925_cov_23.969333_17_plen_87_part_00
MASWAQDKQRHVQGILKHPRVCSPCPGLPIIKDSQPHLLVSVRSKPDTSSAFSRATSCIRRSTRSTISRERLAHNQQPRHDHTAQA